MRAPTISNISHKITSVGDRQTHFGYTTPQQLDRRKAERHESPCFCARAPKNRGAWRSPLPFFLLSECRIAEMVRTPHPPPSVVPLLPLEKALDNNRFKCVIRLL